MAREKRDWSKQEEAFIRENFSRIKKKQLADILGVSVSTMYKKANELGITTYQKKRYTEEEEQYILDNYKEMTLEELAAYFGVTVMAIRLKLSSLLVSGKNVKREDYVYMKISNDKYELPMLVANTAKKLAELDGVSEGYVFSEIYRGEKTGCKTQYIRVAIDDDDDEEDF